MDLKSIEMEIMEIGYLHTLPIADLKEKENKIKIHIKKYREKEKLSKKKSLKLFICSYSFHFYFLLLDVRMWFGEIRRMLDIFFRGELDIQEFIDNEEKKITYIVNPKVANSSLKASVFHLQMMKSYNDVHTHIPSQHKYGKTAHEAFYVFSFVRNPLVRLVSCYENKYHSDRKFLGKTMYKLRFDNYLFGYLKKDRGFKKFVKKVAKIPDFLADRHFKSQYATLYIKGRGLPDYIGKFENLAEDFEPLRQKYDLAPLPHYNSTAKERGDKNWMDYYDLHTAELVYKRYKKDFEVFGYEDEYRKLIAYLKAKEA